jgi:hypothetical protein
MLILAGDVYIFFSLKDAACGRYIEAKQMKPTIVSILLVCVCERGGVGDRVHINFAFRHMSV